MDKQYFLKTLEVEFNFSLEGFKLLKYMIDRYNCEDYNDGVRCNDFKLSTLFLFHLFVFMKVNTYKYVKTMSLI